MHIETCSERFLTTYLVNHSCWPLGYSMWCVFGITKKASWTQDPLVTNFRPSWRLSPFILFNVVLAAKQFHLISLLPPPLTDSIVFSDLMASPSHLQKYRWPLWPRRRAYRRMDAVQTLSLRLPAAGLRRKQTENRTHIKTVWQQHASDLDCNCFCKADSLR